MLHWHCVWGGNVWNAWGEKFLLWATSVSLYSPAVPQTARARCSNRNGQLARECEACYMPHNTEMSCSCMTSTLYWVQWENIRKHCIVQSHFLQTMYLHEHLQKWDAVIRCFFFYWDEVKLCGTALSRVISCDNLGRHRTSDCLAKQRKASALTSSSRMPSEISKVQRGARRRHVCRCWTNWTSELSDPSLFVFVEHNQRSSTGHSVFVWPGIL